MNLAKIHAASERVLLIVTFGHRFVNKYLVYRKITWTNLLNEEIQVDVFYGHLCNSTYIVFIRVSGYWKFMWWWHSKIRTKHQETGIHVRATCTRRSEDVWSESHLPINFPKYVLRRCSTSTLLWGQNYSCTLFERKEDRKHLYSHGQELFYKFVSNFKY